MLLKLPRCVSIISASISISSPSQTILASDSCLLLCGRIITSHQSPYKTDHSPRGDWHDVQVKIMRIPMDWLHITSVTHWVMVNIHHNIRHTINFSKRSQWQISGDPCVARTVSTADCVSLLERIWETGTMQHSDAGSVFVQERACYITS